jgi:hypothetical protein
MSCDAYFCNVVQQYYVVLAKIQIPNQDGTAVDTSNIHPSLFLVPKHVRLEKHIEEAFEQDGIQFNNPMKRNDICIHRIKRNVIGGELEVVDAEMQLGQGFAKDKTGAIGFLLGKEGEGVAIIKNELLEMKLSYAFRGAVLSYQSYLYSVQHASLQDTHHTSSPTSTAHKLRADLDNMATNRLNLQQRFISEGSLALCCHVAYLYDILKHDDMDKFPNKAEYAGIIAICLPIMKLWSTKRYLESNAIAMQQVGWSRDEVAIDVSEESTTTFKQLEALRRYCITVCTTSSYIIH